MKRRFTDVAAELFDRFGLRRDGRGELPGHSQCIDDMILACRNEPEEFVSLVARENQENVRILAPFFEDVASLPNGAEWVNRIEEAVKGKETKDILEEIALAKAHLA